MPTETEIEEPIDGRTARAVRTKDAIVDATLALIDEGDLRPTGPRIAEHAGVSVRSIFQHFDDLDALFAAVGERVVVRIGGLIAYIDPSLPLNDRIDAFVHQRTAVHESLTPVLRAARIHAASSTVIQGQFERGHDFQRLQVAEVFGPEVASAADGSVVLNGLIATLSWPTWELLRAGQGLSVNEARQVVITMVRSLVGADAGPVVSPGG